MGEKSNAIETVLLGYGIRKTVDRYKRVFWVAKCGHCHRELTRKCESYASPEAVAKKMIADDNWTIKRGKVPRCDVCNGYTRRRQPPSRLTLADEIAARCQHPAPLNPPRKDELVAATIGPDPKIRFKVNILLGEHFDADKRLYHADWSDARIAKELDVNPDIVGSLRKEVFGELAEDPMMTQFRRDMEALPDLIADEYAAVEERHHAELLDIKKKLDARVSDMMARFIRLPGAPHNKAAG